MDGILKSIETKITDFFVFLFKNLLFFLSNNHKSLFVSVLHYAIFILGFYYFFFHSSPHDRFRIFFFFLIFLGALSYFTFNKCFFTSIELKLSSEKNAIQSFIDKYFGKEVEGNITSKIVLCLGTIIIGGIIVKDYGIITSRVY